MATGLAILGGAVISGGSSALIADANRNSTGGGKAFLNALIFNQMAFDQQLAQQDQSFQQSLRQFNFAATPIAQTVARATQAAIAEDPVALGLQNAVLADLNSGGRNAALERAFESQISEQLASRGVLNSPRSALSSSFALLQFRESQRQRAFANAAAFSNAPGLGASQGGGGAFAFQGPGAVNAGATFGQSLGFASQQFALGLQAQAAVAGAQMGAGNTIGGGLSQAVLLQQLLGSGGQGGQQKSGQQSAQTVGQSGGS